MFYVLTDLAMALNLSVVYWLLDSAFQGVLFRCARRVVLKNGSRYELTRRDPAHICRS